MKTNILVLISVTIVAVMTSAASASELRGDVDVLLKIGQGCAINGVVVAGVNKFGTVDFGEQSNLALFVDAESTQSGGVGALELTCNNNLSYTVSLDDGVNAQGGQRRVTRGGLDYVQYELYQDAARSVRWGQGPQARALTGTGAAQPITIYGRVLAGQATPAAGDYVDTVRMTIAW